MITADRSRAETDKVLAELELRLKEIYTRAYDTLRSRWDEYLLSLDDEIEKYRLERENAKGKELIEAQKKYASAVQKKTILDGRFRDLAATISENLANANKTALAYINGELPEVYALNYNGMGTLLVDEANLYHVGYTFDLVDADTVRRLVMDEGLDLLPYRELDEEVDTRWNVQKINGEVLQGILLGESMSAIALRLRNIIGMNEVSAIRNARTMITGAENRGRMDSMKRAESMGIILKKCWISSDDSRTRKWHMPWSFASLEVDLDEPFINDGGEIMYPGDPMAHPANIYNCRCTTGTEIVGFRENYLTNGRKTGIINHKDNIYREFQSGQEANDFFCGKDEADNSYSQWKDSLTHDETIAIYNYVGGGYIDLNNYLRKTGNWQQINAEKKEYIAQNLDSAISRYELKDNISVLRGVMNDVVDRLAVQYDVQSSIYELIGKKYIDNGYMSTTALHVGNNVAVCKPTVFDIEIPAGVGRGAYVNQFAGDYRDTEYEFLLKRGASFTILDVIEDIYAERYYIKMVMNDD